MATKVDYAWVHQYNAATLLGYWKFSAYSKAKEFEVIWEWRDSAKKDWVTEGKITVDKSQYTRQQSSTTGKYYYRFETPDFTPPEGAKQVRFRVRPVSDTYTQTVNGKTVTKSHLSGIAWYWTETETLDSALYAPDTPTSFTAERSTQTGTNVRLEWSCTSKLATDVEVWRSANGDKWGKLVTLKRVANGTYLDKTCVVGSFYRYRVRAHNSVGGNYSPYTETLTVEERPREPSNFAAKLASGGGGVQLTWKSNGNTGNGVRVDYATSKSALANNSTEVITVTRDDSEVSNPNNLNTITIGNLDNGVTYYFHLRRTNDVGASGYATTNKKSAGYVSDWMVSCSISKKSVASTPAVGTPTGKALYLTTKGYLRAVFQLPQTAISAMTASGEEEQWGIQFTTDEGTFQSSSTTGVSVEDGLGSMRSKDGVWSYGATKDGWTDQGKGVIYDLTAPSAGSTYRARARRVRGSVKGAWSDILGPVAVPEGAGTATPSTPTLYSLRENGGYLEVAFGNTGARDTESTEIQVSTVNSWATDAITTLVKDGGYTRLYKTSSDVYTMASQTDGAANSEVGSGLVYTWTGAEAGRQYWVRLRRVASDGSTASEWSSTLTITMSATHGSVVVDMPPTGPTLLRAETEDGDGNEGNVVLTWATSSDVAEAASYEFQWTDNAKAFSDNAMGDIETASVELSDVWGTDEDAVEKSYTVTDLTRGTRWYFRVRKTNEIGVGPWAEAAANDEDGGIESYQSKYVCMLDVPPDDDVLSAPTTVATQVSYQTDDVVLMAWAHNSEQDSEQTAFEVSFFVQDAEGNEVEIPDVTGTSDSVCSLDLSDLDLLDGTTVSWKVRTQGAVSGSWSPWSGARSFAVYVAPTTTIGLSDGAGNDLADASAESMPITVTIAASGSSSGNMPVEWWCDLVALEGYDTDSGTVAPNQVLWRDSALAADDGFSDEAATFTIGFADATLVSGISYEVRGGCATAQGTRSSTATPFTVGWTGEELYPNAGIWYDEDGITCHIRPSCSVEAQGDEEDQSTTETLDVLPAEIELPEDVTDGGVVTVTLDGGAVLAQGEGWHLDGHTVVVHYEAGEAPLEVTVTWPELTADDSGGYLRPNTTLAVYRVESDGTTVPIDEDVANDGQSEVIDPHPTLGSCTYRIVAIDESTGLHGSTDIEVDVPEEALVINWDSETLRLPYQVGISESYSPEATLLKFAGRENPVSYFGTQRGQTGTWTTALIADLDADRRKALRRVMAHMGPVYVREPWGLGYWAYVKVRAQRAAGTASESVSLDVTRVETPAGKVG